MPNAVVTGTSTGIGLATALALGRAGYDVYATMRRPEAAPELAASARSERLPIKIIAMDVDDDDSVANAFAKILAESRAVDVLVNNAGIHASGAVEEVPLSVFRRVMETNYFGVLRCTKAVIPGMREQRSGHIVNVSSIGGRAAALSQGPYTASKYALEGMSEELAAEVKPFGIRVALIEPGSIVTPIFDKLRKVPSNTRYPLERRMNALFAAFLKQQVPTSVVANQIVEVVQSKSWTLRHPSGPDALGLLQYRATLSDEQWIDFRAVESDKEFVALVKRDFGLDLDL